MKNNSFKYSVLMSVYVNETKENFKHSVNSMLVQTLPPDEIVIVQDGPIKKEVLDAINFYIDEYPDLLKTIALPKNIGLGPALNEGLKICKNNYIVRMDTDDISVPERVEKQMELFLKNENLSICGGFIGEYDDGNIETIREVPLNHPDILKYSKRKSPFNHVTVIFKRDEILKLGGYRDIRRKEDIDLFIRALNSGMTGQNIPEILVLVKADKNYLSRRKSFENCRSYISVVHKFWLEGYSGFNDLLYVVFAQIGMYLSPNWLMKIISDNFLRKKIKNLTIEELMEVSE